MPPERYPNLVVEVLHGLATAGLLVGAAGAYALFTWAMDGPHGDFAIRSGLGLAVAVGTLLVWSGLKAMALLVTYAWIVQDALCRRMAEAPTRPEPLGSSR